MPNYQLIQFVDGGWEIFLNGKIVTDYLRQYVSIHDDMLTKTECLFIIEETNKMGIVLEN